MLHKVIGVDLIVHLAGLTEGVVAEIPVVPGKLAAIVDVAVIERLFGRACATTGSRSWRRC